jgi:hypothetical protein
MMEQHPVEDRALRMARGGDSRHIRNGELRLKENDPQIGGNQGKTGKPGWQRYGDSNPGLMAENHLS